MTTLAALIEEKNVTTDVKEGAPENPEFPDSFAYTVTLRYQGRQYTIPFYTGKGWTREPNTCDVLESILSDASSVEWDSFEGWADNMGYDRDSRRAERIYKACEREAKNLRRLLGDDFDTFMQAERD